MKFDVSIKKSIKAKTVAEARVTEMKERLKRINNDLSDQHKHDDYNTNKS